MALVARFIAIPKRPAPSKVRRIHVEVRMLECCSDQKLSFAAGLELTFKNETSTSRFDAASPRRSARPTPDRRRQNASLALVLAADRRAWLVRRAVMASRPPYLL